MITSLQVHIISLPKEEERRNKVAEQFGSHEIPYSIFNGINGKEEFGNGRWPWFYNPDKFKKINASRTLSLGDLGCAASHISLWEQLVDSGDHAWIIFEDDICLHDRLNLISLDEMYRATRTNEITLLNHVSVFGFRAGRRNYKKFGGEGRFPIWSTNLAGAYIIGKDAALTLLNDIRARSLLFPTDTWGSLKYGVRGFSELVPVRVVLPAPAWQNTELPSAITKMGRPDPNYAKINQTGRIQWDFTKGIGRNLWFFFRGQWESLFPPKNLPLTAEDFRF